MAGDTRDHAAARVRWLLFALAMAGVYAVLLWHFHGLQFPLDRDELHFWPTSRSLSLPFPLHRFRAYHELNTPLSFLIFGQLAVTGHGLVLSRALNVVLSAAVLVALAASGGERTRAMLSALGLALCPYYLGLSTHVYSDTSALALVVLGLACYFRERHVLAAVAWALAIATRQTMIAFPLAVVANAFFRNQPRRYAPILWPVAAAASLAGWVVVFHGLAPVPQARHPLLPRNVLFLLVCLGIYYVLPEAILLASARRSWREQLCGHGRRIAYAMLSLAAAFIVFPPLGNTIGWPVIPGMGLFDATARHLLPGVARMALYWLLALAAWLRFARRGYALENWLIAGNAGIFLLDPVAWEKYALPLLATLWYLNARRTPEVPSCPEPPLLLEPARLASPPLTSC